jgi:hypothetical protein
MLAIYRVVNPTVFGILDGWHRVFPMALSQIWDMRYAESR